jgi:hypothetical protein
MTTTPDTRPADGTTGTVTSDLDRPGPGSSEPGPVRRVAERIWRTSWRPGAIYVASRAVVLLTIGMVAVVKGGSLGDRIDRWDSRWYLRATQGYPHHLTVQNGHVLANTLAFFPALPLAIRGLSGVTGLSSFAAGVVISSLTGLTATIGVWALVREYAGERAANRVTLLFALFPGAFVFSMIYSEGFVITGAAFGLLALMRRRWVVAGVLGFVATAAAPIALGFVVSCAWASFVAIRRHRDWRSLAAPVLAPLGSIVYLLWTWQHTGVASAFSKTERGGWNSYLSLAYPFRIIGGLIAHPITSFANQRLVFVGIVFVVIALVIAVRDRQPSVILAYGISVAVLALLTAPVGPRPRIILDAFPLILAVGLRYREGWKYRLLGVASLACLVVFTAYEVGSWWVFP